MEDFFSYLKWGAAVSAAPTEQSCVRNYSSLGGAAVSAAPTKPDGTIILTVGVSQNLTNADSASL